MKGKNKKLTLTEKRSRQERRRLSKLAKGGRLVDGHEVPIGAIAADPSQQYRPGCTAKFFYRDIEFICSDCGAEEVWTAKDQKWYFEVVRAPVYCVPKRCSACRKKHRETKALQRKQMEAADRARRAKERGTH
jgi:hypothetical protein